jgi:hypothetical protein
MQSSLGFVPHFIKQHLQYVIYVSAVSSRRLEKRLEKLMFNYYLFIILQSILVQRLDIELVSNIV